MSKTSKTKRPRKQTPSKEPTVFIVDDDGAVRKGISLLLGSVHIRTEAYASAQSFLKAYDPQRSGCLLLDVRMPKMGGLELQSHLAAEGINIPIVIITGYGDVPMAVRAVKMGAVDLIEKPFRDQVLIECVQKAISLDTQLRGEQAEHDVIRKRLDQLTTREREIMEMVIRDRANNDIASDLGLSRKTIEFHRSHMMKKLGVESLVELMKVVLKAQLS